jgi:D-2-hydroxyacid dehydrogenase (NADP+)
MSGALERVLLLIALPERVRNTYRDALCAAFPQLQFDLVEHHSKVGPYIANADALITFGPMLADGVFERARRLKWVQALGTGVDGICDRPALPAQVLVTNMHGIHGNAMAEAALMLMLALSRQLPRSLAFQAGHRWERFPARLLQGKTVGILGVGAIAETLAPICKALGMRVVGISSAPRALPGFDLMRARDDLPQAAADLDFLVLLTPYSPATHGLVGAAVLAALKRECYVINLARGGVVDEPALLEALRAGAIAGAALDVFATEPLPEDSPFWSEPNVIVTAHQGGFHDGYAQSALPVIIHNIGRFLAGDHAGMKFVVSR